MRITLLLIAILALVGCAQRDEPPMLTGAVVSKEAIRAYFPDAALGDDSYAVVNSKWLAWYQEQFEAEMFKRGSAMKWDERQDCNRFAQKFASDAQALYLPTAFHSSVKAQALAIGEAWGKTAAGQHALCPVFTERGLVWWEPQKTAKHEASPLRDLTFSRF